MVLEREVESLGMIIPTSKCIDTPSEMPNDYPHTSVNYNDRMLAKTSIPGGFHADMMILLLSGSVLIVLTICCNWSTPFPA